MELNIGANIKKLRLSKGLTQEQLADILGISPAAVSKWEAKNTYPDIAMLIPLAQVFNVSLDELMQYDETKTKEKIATILHDYRQMMVEGKLSEASGLISRARQNYPHDFQITGKYIEHFSRNKETLLEKKEEIMVLCDCILDNCNLDKIRYIAMQVKAKVLHFSGNTEAAVDLLSVLPRFQAALATEQIFEKHSTEYQMWNRKNCYSLLNIMAVKHARTIQYNAGLSIQEKTRELINLAEVYGTFSQQENSAFYCIGEEAVYWIAANMASECVDIHELIKIREAHLHALNKMEILAVSDPILQELILETYHTMNLVQHQINILKYSPHPQYATPRENPEYMEMLRKWDK